MDNNLILKKLRFIQSYNDTTMMEVFNLGGEKVTREVLSNYLKSDEDEDYKGLYDKQLAIFLNGLIIKLRGSKDGEIPVPEKKLNNNLILRKLKIAFNLKDVDMIEILDLADFKMGKPELNAFFRKPDHKNYRACKDQIIRNFLMGLQLKAHPKSEEK